MPFGTTVASELLFVQFTPSSYNFTINSIYIGPKLHSFVTRKPSKCQKIKKNNECATLLIDVTDALSFNIAIRRTSRVIYVTSVFSFLFFVQLLLFTCLSDLYFCFLFADEL